MLTLKNFINIEGNDTPIPEKETNDENNIYAKDN